MIIFKKTFYAEKLKSTLNTKTLVMQLNTYGKGKLKFNLTVAAFLAIVVLLLIFPSLSFGQDPSGANTGTINDVTAATAGKPTLEEIGGQSGHNKIAINIMWTLITGFLVMFMQAGFAMVETGFTQKKNVAHTASEKISNWPGLCIYVWRRS